MGDSSFARGLQGGGVNVQGGTVAISSCAISGNTAAANVRALIEEFPYRLDGEIPDELASTHFCTTAADAPGNYRMHVPQQP